MEIWGDEGEEEAEERRKIEKERGRRRYQPPFNPVLHLPLVAVSPRSTATARTAVSSTLDSPS